ncbi:MAG: hypothetical protein V1781_10185 [Bacteroidota bacterium]
MVLDSKKTENNLIRKGFSPKKSDHIRLEFWYNGKLTRIRTKLSHNHQEINDYLIGQMAKQIALTRKQFIALADCTLDKNEYQKILKERGII